MDVLEQIGTDNILISRSIPDVDDFLSGIIFIEIEHSSIKETIYDNFTISEGDNIIPHLNWTSTTQEDGGETEDRGDSIFVQSYAQGSVYSDDVSSASYVFQSDEVD